jgi:putative NIF3 family GTP cyclohydrolase 1 type 2
MKAKGLYLKLDKDFGIDGLKDDWSFMNFNDYIAPEFKKSYIGLILDNTDKVNKVYTATMPDLDILEKVILTDETDMLLFSHHAMGYDPTLTGFPFYDIPEEYLLKLKQQRISFYMLHTPLDKNGEYSTSVNLAKHLDLEIIDEFCEYEGVKCGVICKTEKRTATELKEHVRAIIGHEVKLIMHGENKITRGHVAVAAGGGSVGFAAKELVELGINMYITGNTRQVPGVVSVPVWTTAT